MLQYYCNVVKLQNIHMLSKTSHNYIVMRRMTTFESTIRFSNSLKNNGAEMQQISGKRIIFEYKEMFKNIVILCVKNLFGT